MFQILRKLFSSKDEERDFESFIGRMPEYLQRVDIIRSGKLAVKHKKVRPPLTKLPFLEKLRIMPLGLANFRQLNSSLDDLDTDIRRDTIEGHELKALEVLARENKVIAIGYTEVDHDDIFIDKGILFDNAIVISIQMPTEKMKLAPSFDTLRMIMQTYAQTGVAVNEIAAMLRKMGFGAQAGPGLGGFTIYPVLGQKAGMGAFIRSGLLTTPESGPCHRLAVVYTNIKNLPVKEKKQHDWVSEFCENCGLCIEKCPPKAIRTDPITVNEKHLEYIDYDSCVNYFAQNYGCSICVKVCPFFTKGYHKLHDNYLNKKIGVMS